MRYLAIGAVVAAVFFTGYAVFYALRTAPPTAPGGAGMAPGMSADLTPAVKGLYNGQEVTFIHTEVSDEQVAAMLTRMMGPKVLVVPRLAEIPRNLLADVYVFTNGVRGEGPFGFQVDVFDSVPGQPHYTPLRAITLVTWNEGVTPKLLRSVTEIRDAARRGDVVLKRTDIVVNMPILTWPGGQR